MRETRFSSDGKAVVSYSDDRTVRRWDVATEKQLSSHAEHRDERVCKMYSLRFVDDLPNGFRYPPFATGHFSVLSVVKSKERLTEGNEHLPKSEINKT